MSEERARRVGLNEALFREVNEQIEHLTRSFDVGETISIVCECGDGTCTDQLEVSLSAYEQVRANSHRFLIAAGHEMPDVETVVERTEAYTVVEKDDGTPALVAEKTDPRR